MIAPSDSPVRLVACGCITPFGDVRATHAALLRGERALQPGPVRGREGGDLVPLALIPGRVLDETVPPFWLGAARTLLAALTEGDWGGERRPIFVTSSNFGVGNLFAFRREGNPAHLQFGAPALCVEWLRRELQWGANVAVLSHACVSAHLGLLQATRAVLSGAADEALVFSFDFLSPFVASGFHALKILNAEFPAPYAARQMGAIGLGDGAAFAVVARGQGELTLQSQSLFNEMHHFTANQADGQGFSTCLAPLVAAQAGRRLWIKGHGTGTLEAGRLEASAFSRCLPGSPLTGWKGALGHTLGSCGLVELALAVESFRIGQAPGTVGTTAPVFSEAVALNPFSVRSFDGVVCASNAFGGAHAALVLDCGGSTRPRGQLARETSHGRLTPGWSAERFISGVSTDNSGTEEPSATRERLKGGFAPGATRRMTQLGLLIGSVLGEMTPADDDTVVYASGYGESRALEGFLDSFPDASPTLFQTSIHPSAVQQALIGRQRSLREVFPLAGSPGLPAHALLLALLAPAERVLFCGGEECGTWLLANGVASDRTFAFALALTRTPGPHQLGRIVLSKGATQDDALTLPAFFDALRVRRFFSGLIGPGLHLELSWS